MKICVVGMGYIGLPTALMMAANGLDGRKSAIWIVTGRRGFRIVGSNVKERNRLRISVKAAKRPIWR